jgi:hypothetical protein
MLWLTLLLASIFVLLGRFLFHGWFNHLSIYAGIWGFSLSALQLELIDYYPFAGETWLFVAAGGFAFIFGSITPVAAWFAAGGPAPAAPAVPAPAAAGRELETLRLVLWVLNAIALATVIQHWVMVLRQFGSVANVLFWGNLVYSFRVERGIPGAIPYFDALALAGSLLAGAYTARSGKVRPVAVLPFLIVLANEIAVMGRARLIMAAVLFVSGYFFTPRRARVRTVHALGSRLARAATVIVALTVLLAGAEFVRSTRGATEQFRGAKPALYRLTQDAFITPSMYLYASAQTVVFSQYLKSGGEATPWGNNTFAPVYRILGKLGFDVGSGTYQKFYRTPHPSNTGTYLRELHADFGPAGVLLGPYLLGITATLAWRRVVRRFRYADLAVLGYVYTLVGMSILYVGTRAGDLLMGVISAWVVGWVVDRSLGRQSGAVVATPVRSGAIE